MLPTTYRGDANVDGERIPAVLRLGEDTVSLLVGDETEVLNWPITSLEVIPSKKGGYELRRGAESFQFAPEIDDGLGDEISLRRRFSSSEPPAVPPTEPLPTIADRVAAAGTGTHRPKTRRDRQPALLEGKDLGIRSAVVILAVLAGIVTTVAVVSGSMEGQPTTVVVGADAPLPTATAPAEEPSPVTSVPPTSAVAEEPESTAPTTVAPTVAPATVTTQPPATTAIPAGGSVFEMTPDEMISRWNALAGAISTDIAATSLSSGDGAFGFEVGNFVTVEGVTRPDGTVRRLVFFGDPSGTVEDDRRVLSALGISVALVEPDLPPEGRRELLKALGLDVDNPVLEGLDGALEYRDNAYALRWDPELGRIVFDVTPAAELEAQNTEEGSPDG